MCCYPGDEDRSRAKLTNCTFSENFAAYRGGSIYSGSTQLKLIKCIFEENGADKEGGSLFNGYAGTATLTNCIFNMSGSVHNEWLTKAKLANCTFVKYRKALVCDSHNQLGPSSIELMNCILWDGGNEIVNNDNSAITILYSDVEGGWPGQGNIAADPLFVNEDSQDYHLLPTSPCIDAGDPNYIAEPNETDLDGNPRIIGGRIDIGAYESPLQAKARIVPHTINLASKGNWITCYIHLPEDCDIADIDPDTILLEGRIKAESVLIDEQQQVATVRFSREQVQAVLDIGETNLTITGQLKDAACFEAIDTVKVINKAGKN
jgi:predicted outer membrane repeat protein